MLGARRISEQRVSRRNNDDLRLDHVGTVLTRAGEYARGGVRARETHLTPPTDAAVVPLCELMAMNSNGYPAVWSAKLVSLTQIQVAAIEPVNVVMRVVYNTLDGIVNDYFVITASVAER